MLRRRTRGALPLWILASAVASTALATGREAHAQQQPPSGRRTGAPAITSTLVRNHFESGTAYFEVGRYPDAVREFELAYELSPQPEFLFNLGRAREAAGNPSGALEAFERFLSAGAPGFSREARDSLDERMSGLRARVAAERARANALPIAPPPTPPTPPTRPAPAPPPSRGVAHIVGPSLLFAGGAALGGLAVWQLLEYRAEVSRLDRANLGEHPWGAADNNAGRAARQSTTLTVAFSAGGAALLAGGVVWLAVGLARAPASPGSEPRSARRTQVLPWSNGQALGLVGFF